MFSTSWINDAIRITVIKVKMFLWKYFSSRNYNLDCLHSFHHQSESWDDDIRKFLHCTICKYKQHAILIEDWPVSTGVLKVVTEMFLPHIELSELEKECFSKILPKVSILSNSRCVLSQQYKLVCLLLQPRSDLMKWKADIVLRIDRLHCLVMKCDYSIYQNSCVHVTGSNNVWEHDERSPGSGRRLVQPKHSPLFLTKKYPPGTLSI